jgi:hypothetical protein
MVFNVRFEDFRFNKFVVSATEGSRRTGHKGLLRTEYEMVNFCEFDSKGT